MVSVDRLGEAGVAGVGGTIWLLVEGAGQLICECGSPHETLMDATAFFSVLAAFQPVKVFADLVVRARLALGLGHDCIWSCWLGAFGRGAGVRTMLQRVAVLTPGVTFLCLATEALGVHGCV